jgi:hypothetical protein
LCDKRPIDKLKFDPTNPRVVLLLTAAVKSSGEKNPSQDFLRDLLWEDDDVKALKNSIELYGGLIEAIIVSNDGTVLEGTKLKTILRAAERTDDLAEAVAQVLFAMRQDLTTTSSYRCRLCVSWDSQSARKWSHSSL